MSCMARRNLLINGDDENENPTGSVVVITIVRNSNSIAMHNHKPIKIKLIITKTIKINMIIIKITICPSLNQPGSEPPGDGNALEEHQEEQTHTLQQISNIMIFLAM